MKTLLFPYLTGVAVCTLMCVPVLNATEPPHVIASVQTAADNSKQNKSQAPTADDQQNAKGDRDITAKIRQTIIADKSLSMYAHNVKIITTNGAVTLKGPVKSEDEKQKVASDAASIVTADKVSNQLTVKP